MEALERVIFSLNKAPLTTASAQEISSLALTEPLKNYKIVPHILEKFAAKAAAALTTVYVLDVIARHAVKVPDAQKLMERFREKLTTIFRWVVPSDVQEKDKILRVLSLWRKSNLFVDKLGEIELMILGHGGDPSQSHQPHQSHLSHAPVVVNTAVSSLLATIQSLNSAAAPPSSVSAVSPPPELGWLKALEVSPTSAPPAPSIHPERQRPEISSLNNDSNAGYQQQHHHQPMAVPSTLPPSSTEKKKAWKFRDSAAVVDQSTVSSVTNMGYSDVNQGHGSAATYLSEDPGGSQYSSSYGHGSQAQQTYPRESRDSRGGGGGGQIASGVDESIPISHVKVLSRTLYLGGLPDSVTREQVIAAFDSMENVYINLPKHNAFLKFYTRELAEAGLLRYSAGERLLINGQMIKVSWACSFGPKEFFDYNSGTLMMPLSEMNEDEKALIGETGGRIVDEPKRGRSRGRQGQGNFGGGGGSGSGGFSNGGGGGGVYKEYGANDYASKDYAANEYRGQEYGAGAKASEYIASTNTNTNNFNYNNVDAIATDAAATSGATAAPDYTSEAYAQEYANYYKQYYAGYYTEGAAVVAGNESHGAQGSTHVQGQEHGQGQKRDYDYGGGAEDDNGASVKRGRI